MGCRTTAASGATQGAHIIEQSIGCRVPVFGGQPPCNAPGYYETDSCRLVAWWLAWHEATKINWSRAINRELTHFVNQTNVATAQACTNKSIANVLPTSSIGTQRPNKA